MTPADELRRAADVLERRAAAATPGPWLPGNYIGTAADTAWITTMSPAVAAPLVAWLRLAAKDYKDRESMRKLGEPPRDQFDSRPIDVLGSSVLDSWQVRALDFARAVLREAT